MSCQHALHLARRGCASRTLRLRDLAVGVFLLGLVMLTAPACKSVGKRNHLALPPDPRQSHQSAGDLLANGDAGSSTPYSLVESVEAQLSAEAPARPRVQEDGSKQRLEFPIQAASHVDNAGFQSFEQPSPNPLVCDVNGMCTEPALAANSAVATVAAGVALATRVTDESMRYPVATQALLELPTPGPPSSESIAAETMAASAGRAFRSVAGESLYAVRLYIQGIRPGRGDVKVALFTDPQTFPTPQHAAATRTLSANEPQLTAEFTLQTRVAVAVAVYQDLDGNGTLTRGRAGIPVEPFAFSNDAPMRRGPPSFADAAVPPPTTTGEPTTIVLKLP